MRLVEDWVYHTKYIFYVLYSRKSVHLNNSWESFSNFSLCTYLNYMCTRHGLLYKCMSLKCSNIDKCVLFCLGLLKNSCVSGFPTLPKKNSPTLKFFSPFQKLNCVLFRSALGAKRPELLKRRTKIFQNGMMIPY